MHANLNFSRLAVACALLASAGAFAQVRSVQSTPNTAARASTPAVTNPGGLTSPNPAGLQGTLPAPAGLQSQAPSGLTSGTGAVVAPNSTGAPASAVANGTVLPNGNIVNGGVVPGQQVLTAAGEVVVVPQTAVMGGPGVPAVPQSVSSGPGPYTAQQLAGSFIRADANRDGDLTRAEATRLSIMLGSFEEMDRNKDGVLTRSEYEDGAR